MILVSDKSTQKTYYFPKEKNSGKAAFLKLFSHLSKNEYLFNVSGSAVLDLYYALSPDFSDVPNGEYDYTIYDAENNVLQNGLLRIGEYDAGDIIYDFKEEYIVYNPETGESEIIEYGDCTDAVNEAYRSGYTSGYADGYDEGSESGTGGYESGYTSGYTDGFNSGYSSGKTDGLKEGFDNGVVSGFSGGYTSGYTDGYSSGYTEGYEDAYDSGLQVGIESGKTIGFESGWTNGYSSGYTDGYGSGYESGNTDGFNSGYTNGYTEGYSSGWTDGYTSGSTPTPTPPTSGFESMYFTIQPLYDGNISWDAPNLSYRIDNGSWMPMSGTVAVERGQELQIKGTNTCYSGYTITTNFGFDVYGNIMSLVYGDNFENQTTLTEDGEFSHLFQNKLVRNAENLILPATTLAANCYGNMFSGCRALLTPPALPATTLSEGCYQYMFDTCTSLTEAPALPATTLAERCYQSMFYGCTSLVEAPELPATTLNNYCYAYMFYDCTSLTQAPELPATTLAQSCYNSMFRKCTSLTQAPELPATTLAQSCYNSMFRNCTSLTEVPELPATTLNYYCYAYMFDGCTNLNYIKCLATDISATYCTRDWTNGVASAGTFVKAEEMSGWTVDSPNGIPVGWTVENDNPTDYSKKRFSIEMLEDGDIEWAVPNLYYDIIRNGQRDAGYQLDHSILGLLAGDVVEFYVASDITSAYFVNHPINSSARHITYGNVMSLYYVDFEDKDTLLYNQQFMNLFQSDSGLVDAENLILPATNTTEGCYMSMFAYTLIEKAPVILANSLATRACWSMFYGCSNLKYIKCLATDISSYDCTRDWVKNVSATGTFVKDANMSSWTTGNYGIPSGWTVISE